MLADNGDGNIIKNPNLGPPKVNHSIDHPEDSKNLAPSKKGSAMDHHV
jgi:hypothetical protein